MQLGIVGMPNAGKSTLFNALTRASAAVSAYPFCTIEPNVGVVPVPDERLETLARIVKPPRTVPATVRFIDIAGLVRNASRGEGLGNQFLAHIREVDAVVHVVRAFRDEQVAHVEGGVDPLRDVEIVETELLLADLGTVEKRLQKTGPAARRGDKKAAAEERFLRQLAEHLNRGEPPTAAEQHGPDDAALLRDLHLLTAKPVLYVINVDEEGLSSPPPSCRDLEERARARGAQTVTLCCKLEAEIAELENEEEARELLASYGLEESGLRRLVVSSYRLLDLITFFTVVGPEVRAWSIPRGTTAAAAAGKIHSDMERGFIKAEVASFNEFVEHGSLHALREAGVLRAEGRDYVVRDGDVLLIRFST